MHALVGLGEYLLVCREDFPPRHAYLVARTLSEHRARLPLVVTAPDAGPGQAPVPTHPGALAFYQGLPMPQPADNGQ